MAKRDWLAIGKIDDYHFRVAVSLCTDPALLAGYERGFPHLFMKGKEEGPLCVPLSALREAAAFSTANKADSDPEWASHFCLTWGMDDHPQLNVPVLSILFGDEVEVPWEVRTQLCGQVFQAGMSVSYRGIVYVVVYIDVAEYCKDGDEDEGFKIGGVLDPTFVMDPTDFTILRLVRAEFIDLNA